MALQASTRLCEHRFCLFPGGTVIKTRTITLLVLVGFWTQPAAAGSNPYLRLLQNSERLRTAWKPVRMTPAGPVPRMDLPSRIPALVQTLDAETTARAATELGGGAGAVRGEILTVWGTLEILAEIAERPEVLMLEATPPRRLHLDLSGPAVRTTGIEAGRDLPMPIDGTGVIVGLVDTGVDYKHMDFSNQTGMTRVQAIWDQTGLISGTPPPGQSIGVYCDRDSLLGRPFCQSEDRIGHGTHVAATMASSDGVYRGMAPRADIMAVTSIGFGLLMESIAWLFEQAQAEGKPMVINLSMGYHYGPHDGTSLESRSLSELTGPGRIIVASAGNEGSGYIHLGYDPQGGVGKTQVYVFTSLDVSAGLLTTWVDPGADLSFAIGVQDENGEVAETDFTPPTSTSRVFQLEHDGQALGRVLFELTGQANPDNGKFQIDILVEPEEIAYHLNDHGYWWYIKVQGSGTFDCWAAETGLFVYPARFNGSSEGGNVPGDNRKSVGLPAVATGVIAIGSFATRASWVDVDGFSISSEDTVPGEISIFSSLGPSADPERTGPKPFIAAPGEYIVAALSGSSDNVANGTQIDSDPDPSDNRNGGHVAMRGTSMSSPHVAGISALLLQLDPNLDPNGVRAILAATARRDADTGEDLPNHTWGYGKIDAWEAVAYALGVGVCSDQGECAEGWVCGMGGRCQQVKGGCSCGGRRSVESLWTALGFFFLAGLLARRRRNRRP